MQSIAELSVMSGVVYLDGCEHRSGFLFDGRRIYVDFETFLHAPMSQRNVSSYWYECFEAGVAGIQIEDGPKLFPEEREVLHRAYVRALSLNRPFTERELVQDAWDNGIDMPLYHDPLCRFEYIEVNGVRTCSADGEQLMQVVVPTDYRIVHKDDWFLVQRVDHLACWWRTLDMYPTKKSKSPIARYRTLRAAKNYLIRNSLNTFSYQIVEE